MQTTNQELSTIFDVAKGLALVKDDNGSSKFEVTLQEGIAEGFGSVPKTRSCKVEFEQSSIGFNVLYTLDYSIFPVPMSDFTQDCTRTINYSIDNSSENSVLNLESFDNIIPEKSLQLKQFTSAEKSHYFQITSSLDFMKKIVDVCTNEIQGKTDEVKAEATRRTMQSLTDDLLDFATRKDKRTSE